MVGSGTDARTATLLLEAARISDRLDDMADVIAGKGVLQLLRFRLVDDDGRVAEVKFDGVLAEARQQATALKAILAQVGVPALDVKPARRSTLDEVAEKRAARDAGTARSAAPGV